MNNKNKILVGCLALLLVLSVGYALFSETITINGTATAKGNFKFEAMCSTTLPQQVLAEYGTGVTDGGFSNATCTPSGTIVTSSVDLLYPSSNKFFYAEFKNTGSIAGVVKYDSEGGLMNATLDGTLKLYDKETKQLIETITDINTVTDGIYRQNYAKPGLDKFFIKKQDGNYIQSPQELLANNKVYTDTSGNMYVKIEPGESFVVTYQFIWDEEAEQTDYYSEVNMILDIDIIQETSDLQIQTENKAPEFCINYC